MRALFGALVLTLALPAGWAGAEQPPPGGSAPTVVAGAGDISQVVELYRRTTAIALLPAGGAWT